MRNFRNGLVFFSAISFGPILGQPFLRLGLSEAVRRRRQSFSTSGMGRDFRSSSASASTACEPCDGWNRLRHNKHSLSCAGPVSLVLRRFYQPGNVVAAPLCRGWVCSLPDPLQCGFIPRFRKMFDLGLHKMACNPGQFGEEPAVAHDSQSLNLLVMTFDKTDMREKCVETLPSPERLSRGSPLRTAFHVSRCTDRSEGPRLKIGRFERGVGIEHEYTFRQKKFLIKHRSSSFWTHGILGSRHLNRISIR